MQWEVLGVREGWYKGLGLARGTDHTGSRYRSYRVLLVACWGGGGMRAVSASIPVWHFSWDSGCAAGVGVYYLGKGCGGVGGHHGVGEVQALEGDVVGMWLGPDELLLL